MEVIVQYAIGTNVDREHRGQQLESVANPLPAMFVVSPADGIIAAEKAASNAAGVTMVHTNLGLIENFVARAAWHVNSQFDNWASFLLKRPPWKVTPSMVKCIYVHYTFQGGML